MSPWPALFNHWAHDELNMQSVNKDIWKIEIPMLPHGKYYYKFFIDDRMWMEDIENPLREPDWRDWMEQHPDDLSIVNFSPSPPLCIVVDLVNGLPESQALVAADKLQHAGNLLRLYPVIGVGIRHALSV